MVKINEKIDDTERFLWGDAARVLAMTMVLFLHAAAPHVDRFSVVPPNQWAYSNFVHAITRAAVPLFFMLSGMLLLRPARESLLSFYRKRFTRILPPLLFWSVVYLVWGNIHHDKQYTPLSGLMAIVNGEVRFHLWFVYVLIGLYLITPLLRLIITRFHRNLVLGLVITWFGVIVLVPYLTDLNLLDIGLKTDVQIINYLGYYLLGHLLADIKLTTKFSRWSWFGIWCAAAAATTILSYNYSMENSRLIIKFYEYTSLNVVVMTTALFLLLKSLPFEKLFAGIPKSKSIILKISGVSYGIYISHVLFQEIMWENWPENISAHPLMVIPVIVVSVGLLTTAFQLAASRIPIVKNLVN